MFITTQLELVSLMPTTRWDRPEQLFGYLEEEERVALEPLLGTTLYQWLCEEYVRLKTEYIDITAATIRANRQAKTDPRVPYADVTERLDQLQAGAFEPQFSGAAEGNTEVPKSDMQTIRLLRICQQIEFYKMLSHKAGLLTVSFNEGGGMNIVSADGYDGADEKAKDRVVKDAFMSAGRAIDSLLLFLEADAKGDKQFTEKWSEADAFYLHKDLLFQTARVLNEYLDIKSERMAYVQLVRDIRFCQNTYLKPRIGAKLLNAVIAFANNGEIENGKLTTPKGSQAGSENEVAMDNDGSDSSSDEQFSILNSQFSILNSQFSILNSQFSIYKELQSLLRTALAFYVESRRTTIGPKDEKLARRDSMTDAQQAMAAACQYVEENLDAFGEAASDSPIYRAVKEMEEQTKRNAKHAETLSCRRRADIMQQNRRKLFTAFPATHRTPELK